MFWGGMWGSNPRHSEPQSDALPTELKPPYSRDLRLNTIRDRVAHKNFRHNLALPKN